MRLYISIHIYIWFEWGEKKYLINRQQYDDGHGVRAMAITRTEPIKNQQNPTNETKMENIYSTEYCAIERNKTQGK